MKILPAQVADALLDRVGQIPNLRAVTGFDGFSMK